MIEILTGDCRETLAGLEGGRAQCCVTSPPYWGLRDYGTATWEGGDPKCEHTTSHYNDSLKPEVERPFRGDRSKCLNCGAKRIDSQLGLEATPEEYVDAMVGVFRAVRRVLKDDGTLWLNLGDTYAGGASAGNKTFGNPEFNENRPSREATKTPQKTKPSTLKAKDIVGIPWRVAFALQADGWYLRQDIIWSKPNPMPESVTDRCTKAHEYLFLLAKQPKYYYDSEAIREEAAYDGRKDTVHKGSAKYKDNTHLNNQNAQSLSISERERWITNEDGEHVRNKRSVWSISTQSYKDAHFATFPPALITPCILAGSRAGDTVLDPFAGSGTTGKVAIENGRKGIMCELNPDYIDLIKRRTNTTIGFGF